MPDVGRYRIQVVSELTGVPAPTLRAWERRYGIPTPARTASAYRLYSDHDVSMVGRLRDLCSKGISIAEAAKMVRASDEGAATLTGSDGDPYAVAMRRLRDAVGAFDARAVEREAARALYLGPATTVYERVFAPLMRDVGECWEKGTLTVAQEHMTTQALSDVVRGLMRLTNPDTAPFTVLLACPEHEDHALPLYGVALRLASWGIAHVTFGPRTPAAAIEDAVRHLRPSAVGLSVTIAVEPADTAAFVRAYAGACGSTPWFIGGVGVGTVAEDAQHAGAFVIEGAFANARPGIERLVRAKHDG